MNENPSLLERIKLLLSLDEISSMIQLGILKYEEEFVLRRRMNLGSDFPNEWEGYISRDGTLVISEHSDLTPFLLFRKLRPQIRGMPRIGWDNVQVIRNYERKTVYSLLEEFREIQFPKCLIDLKSLYPECYSIGIENEAGDYRIHFEVYHPETFLTEYPDLNDSRYFRVTRPRHVLFTRVLLSEKSDLSRSDRR